MNAQPQTRLAVNSEAKVAQLVVVDDPRAKARDLWILGEPNNQWAITCPRAAFPWLKPGMVVNFAAVLTAFTIEPVEEPSLVTPDGRDLKANPGLIIPGKSN